MFFIRFLFSFFGFIALMGFVFFIVLVFVWFEIFSIVIFFTWEGSVGVVVGVGIVDKKVMLLDICNIIIVIFIVYVCYN